MQEIAKLMTDEEFEEFFQRVERDLPGKDEKGAQGRIIRANWLINIVTVCAGKRDERHFSESQLKRIFELVN